MLVRTFALGAALAAGFAFAPAAAAPVLTSNYAAWQAAAGAHTIVTTSDTGLFDPFALVLPTTTTVSLASGNTIALSTPAQVTQPQNGFPYLLANGITPDLLIPVDAAGNQVKVETISLAGGMMAFGFTVVPFSSNLNGPFTITMQTSDGQTLSVSLPGGSFNPGTSAPAFLGYYGGAEASVTLTTTDANGFAFGNFTEVSASASVPEPASLAMLAGAVGLLGLWRRRA